MVDVLVVGHLNWDVTLRVDTLPVPDGEAAIVDRDEHAGGSAGNVAVGLAQLGVAVGVGGCVGTDDRGEQIVTELRAAGVDTTAIQCDPTLPTTPNLYGARVDVFSKKPKHRQHHHSVLALS